MYITKRYSENSFNEHVNSVLTLASLLADSRAKYISVHVKVTNWEP